ncbi:hypothetical protein ACJZL3_02585 [Wolbachia endosymbiont of Rhagoletis cingulata]
MNLNTTDKQEQPIQDSSELIEKGGCKKCVRQEVRKEQLVKIQHG